MKARERGSIIQMMMKAKSISGEARALERGVGTAREVQAASLRLETHPSDMAGQERDDRTNAAIENDVEFL